MAQEMFTFLDFIDDLDFEMPMAGMAFGGVNELALTSSSEPMREVDRVRNVFPETWLWTNASIGYKRNTNCQFVDLFLFSFSCRFVLNGFAWGGQTYQANFK